MKLTRAIEKLKKGSDLKIAALGDSLTQGWMVRKGYLDFLKEMLMSSYPACRLTIMNRGIPGDTAIDGLRRVRDDIIERDPDVAMVQFALNDAFIGYSPDEFKYNLKRIVEEIANNTDAEIALLTSVFLCNPNENKMAIDFYERIEELAAEFNLPIARVHEYWEKKISEGAELKKLVQFDMVHPTVEGYRLMAEEIFNLYKE
jgi:acyl-CoA thioesterase I